MIAQTAAVSRCDTVDANAAQRSNGARPSTPSPSRKRRPTGGRSAAGAGSGSRTRIISRAAKMWQAASASRVTGAVSSWIRAPVTEGPAMFVPARLTSSRLSASYRRRGPVSAGSNDWAARLANRPSTPVTNATA